MWMWWLETGWEDRGCTLRHGGWGSGSRGWDQPQQKFGGENSSKPSHESLCASLAVHASMHVIFTTALGGRYRYYLDFTRTLKWRPREVK